MRIQRKLYVGEADFRAYISWPYPRFVLPYSFYQTHLPQKPAISDYRRTLYWNPNLQLDKRGEANVTFYNNSRQTILSIEAEGQAADGILLWTK